MKLLIEEYAYPAADVADILDGLFTLQDINSRINVSYVGYYYNPKIRDCVFILPKVLINEQGYVFGKYLPAEIIDMDEGKLSPHEAKFIYEFAVWIHRAIVVFNTTHPGNTIVHYRHIEQEGHGAKKRSSTLLDIILSLIRFNHENRSFFTFVLKNIHSGHNKINWSKTISSTAAVVQDETPIYLHPVNKKRQINFDEELIVIFYSILNYISAHFGFKAALPFGFKLIKGAQFDKYINGLGRKRLRQIKYKYFSDVAMRLWDMCYAFFDKAYQIKVNTSQSEYLLVKDFNIVFEAIIDELIGDHDIPAGLKEQADGKLIDHFYTYDGLIVDRERNNDIYYIGDSKYYKIGSNPGKESVYKQYTYARNVIQWNLNLFLNHKAMEDEKDRFRSIELRDPLTEGYNVIPNFFISAKIDPETLSYDDRTERHPHQPPINRQFKNRLYDRDTLLVSHYDVNFLFVLSLYARDNAGEKLTWKNAVRHKFRKAVQEMLAEHFDFYAMAAHPGVDAAAYLKSNFQATLGKTFRPFDSGDIFSLALDRDPEFADENQRLLADLSHNFHIVPCPLGENPMERIEAQRAAVGHTNAHSELINGMFLFGIVNKIDGNKEITAEYQSFVNHQATSFVMRNMPGGDITKVRYFVPIFDGGIAGYYDVTGITFGSRLQETPDRNGNMATVKMPCLNIKLGSYTPLGDHTVQVPKLRNWNGQIHTHKEVMELYRSQL